MGQFVDLQHRTRGPGFFGLSCAVLAVGLFLLGFKNLRAWGAILAGEKRTVLLARRDGTAIARS